MNAKQITQLITSGESDRIERTVSVSNTDKFSEAVCAFANDLPHHKQPGYLLIGVKHNGTLSGLKATDELLKNVEALRSERNILPPSIIQIEKFTYSEGDVAVVGGKPSFFSPVRYKGKVWIRIGSRKAIANEAEEHMLIEKRQAGITSFDSCPLANATLEDLDVELFKHHYLPKVIHEKTLNQDTRSLSEKWHRSDFWIPHQIFRQLQKCCYWVKIRSISCRVLMCNIFVLARQEEEAISCGS